MSIKIELEKCCYNCECPKIEILENKLISFLGCDENEVTIKCENEKICKYLEQLKEQK